MPEERTLVANLVPQIGDAELQKFLNELNEGLSSTVSVNLGDSNSDSSVIPKEEVKEMGKSLDDIKNTLQGKDGSTSLSKIMGESMSGIKSGLNDVLKGSMDGISNMAGSVIEGVGKLIANPMAMLTGIFGVVMFIADLANKLFNRLVQASPFLKNILDLFNMALNLILGPLGTAIGIELIPMITKLYERIMKGVQAIWSAYEEGGLPALIKETFKTLWDAFTPLIPQIIEIGITIIQAFAKALADMVTDSASGGFGQIVRVLGDSFTMGGFSTMSTFSKLQFAEGGEVEPRPGGVWSLLAEAGEKEYVVPESKKLQFSSNVMSNVGGTVYNYITVNGYTDSDLTGKIESVLDKRTDASRLMGGL